MELKDKRVLVVGLGKSGVASALFLKARGARVTVSDTKSGDELRNEIPALLDHGITVETGGHGERTFREQDLIVVSPGVPANIPALAAARKKGIAIWSEIELAWRYLRGKLVAITGSNGKTTTTSLVGHILRTSNIPTHVGGNIGTPLLSFVERSSDTDVTVAEVSSFQLETVDAFRPEIGVMLNLTPDHLDRHATFEDYAAAKMRMFENQLERDWAVLNADDPEVTKRTPAKPKLCWFSRQKRVAVGAFLLNDNIMFRNEGFEVELAKRSQIPLRGEHNLENVLAACAASYLAGATPAAIAKGVKTFQAVEHRLEFVAEIGGVEFFNDSKATNVDAAVKALEAFPSGLRVILGGKDKGSPYTPLVPLLKERARQVLLIGAAAPKIADDLAELGTVVPIERADTLERAVHLAYRSAEAGDTVLLAPACSSFDQFENYEHRGRTFKQVVQQLAEESSAGASATAAPLPEKG
jgi:UDP-N-acetylmuramoylalanine--D-glutamate ligase